MRTILLMITALLVAALMFVVVRMMSGADPGAGSGTAKNLKPTTIMLPETGGSVIGAGQTAGWDKYDEKTGRLSSRIRVERYEPQADRRMKVDGLRIDLSISDDQFLRVIGRTGLITMLDSEKKNTAVGVDPGLGRPRSGEMKDVKLLILKDLNQKDDEATVRIAMDNLSFDCETWRIQTEAYQESAEKAVAAEWVPVSVRGDEYEFDGYGLSLQYNEGEKRLDYLRVAHGKRLLVTNTDILEKGKPAPAAGLWKAQPEDFSIYSALFGAARAGTARPAASKPAAPASTVYRATFKENVLVKQAGDEVARSKEMTIDFLMVNSGAKKEKAGTQPSTMSKASTRAAREKAEPVAPAGDEKAGEPIEVNWTGPLVVIPTSASTSARIAPNEAIVNLSGDAKEPVLATWKDKQTTTKIQCASLTYWTVDHGARIEEGENLPVELTDNKGSKITTKIVEYSEVEGKAVVYGASKAKWPVEGKEGATEMMDVSWKDRCTLFFTPGKSESKGLGQLQANRALLQGDVSVVHPQFSLSSSTQDILMETLGGKPMIKQVDADGNVKCLAKGEESETWNLGCDSMRMTTSAGDDGKLYPRTLVAQGKVVADDSQRKLSSGYMNISLKQPSTQPTTQPSKAKMELASLLASDNVKITTVDGAEATADQLNIEEADKVQTLTLLGKPATVKNKTETLVGPMLTVRGSDLSKKDGPNEFAVTGAGKLTGIQKDDKGGKDRPFEVTWSRGLTGKGNDIGVDGDVKAQFVESDGSVNVATGEKALLTLAATTRPAARPAGEAKKPGELELMSDRKVQAIVLSGSAKCLSTLNDEKGTLVRRFQVASDQIRFDKKKEGEGLLEIPGAGTLLFQDLRPSANNADSKERAGDPLSPRGTTAFKWSKSLTYDQKLSRITMSGKVLAARQAEGDESPIQVSGDEIIADIVPAEGDGGDAMAMGGIQTKMELKKAKVVGNVLVQSDQIYMMGHEIEFDPGKHQLTVRGQEGVQARQLDPKTELEIATFDELVYDTLTNKDVKATNLNVRSRR